MSLDRSDVQHPAKEIYTMVNPTRRSWKMLKKACRFLKGVQKVTRVMGPWIRGAETHIDVHVDSDRAKGPERKSTNGGMMTINGNVVQHCSRTQASRALSTAEAEYYAVITVAAEGLGMQSMMTDLSLGAQVRVWTDSNAAKAIASRRELGKTRRTELTYLRLQEVTRSGRVKTRRVTRPNLADHFTEESRGVKSTRCPRSRRANENEPR